MMWIRQLFQLLIDSTRLVPGVRPASADGVAAAALTLTKNAAAWTWGAWVEIVSAANLTADTQITAFTLTNFVGAVAQGEIQIGTGAGGAEAVIATYDIGVAGQDQSRAVKVRAGTRIAARYRNANAVADTVDIKLSTVTGF